MRRERLRKMAMEVIDLKTDPYFMRNHLGGYECKLCLTLHTNEGSYLAHTQGKKHQMNLAMRAARDARDASKFDDMAGAIPGRPLAGPGMGSVPLKTVIRIGRPGYKVMKIRDPLTARLGLLFQIMYPHIGKENVPRHRFMSTYEQTLEPPDRNFQYLVVAADPYELIAFKIQAKPLDENEDAFWSYWDDDSKIFTLQFFFDMTSFPELMQSGGNGYEGGNLDA